MPHAVLMLRRSADFLPRECRQMQLEIIDRSNTPLHICAKIIRGRRRVTAWPASRSFGTPGKSGSENRFTQLDIHYCTVPLFMETRVYCRY